jgi:hypothetical protein
MPNRLARECSPYLLQHAANPVDWFPWGAEAFERARREDKPIFLSVGYATCHWCHVMAHESFESPEAAAVLNEHFVSVKVDREERPDVDRVHMLFVQATTGSGGWPMSVWLTPELQPFFGGTYFPPTSRWGRPGFVEVLREIARAWRDDRARVTEAASEVVGRLAAIAKTGGGDLREADDVPGPAALERAAEAFGRRFDGRHGGFGGAPKFPRPSELLFLLRAHERGGGPWLDMVLATLRGLSLGGVRDHLGGGFHRYSVDEAWRVPHFEKMLYDQAQLVLALLEAGQASGDPLWDAVAGDTLAYVARELTHPDGGFYSAEDADSVPPEAAGTPGARASEGAFYLWSAEEVQALLGPDAPIVTARFGVEAGGNAPHDPHGEFAGRNILYIARSVEDVAARTGVSPSDAMAALARARRVLLDARARRPRPSLDDKVLAAWNGLMIAACARAARTFGGDAGDEAQRSAGHALAMAQRAARFVSRELWHAGTGTLLRRFRAGAAGIPAFAEDYACLGWGLLELFQADGDPEWLEWAIALHDRLNQLFWDEEGGGWFSTTGEDPSVLLRLRDDHDGAEPSATSVAVGNALTLAHLLGEERYLAQARRVLSQAGARIERGSGAVPMLLCGLAQWHALASPASPATGPAAALAPGRGALQIVVAGPRGAAGTRALHAVIARRYLPHAIVIPVEPGPRQETLAVRLPWIAAMMTRDERPAAYVCRDFACLAPVTTAQELEALLDGRGPEAAVGREPWATSRRP